MRAIPRTWCCGVLLAAMLTWPAAACPERYRDESPRPELPAPVAMADAARADALVFFETLVEQYRLLTRYRDRVHIVQTTQRDGEQPHRVVTSATTTLDRNELRVETPVRQVAKASGLRLPFIPTPAMLAAQRQYDLWLAPHMGLRFSDRPLDTFRLGVEEGFTPTRAQHVTVNRKPMVQVELRSGDGLSADCTATFDLYVNPTSMLVERIEGEQRLPDGTSHHTVMDITPEYAERAAPISEPDPTAMTTEKESPEAPAPPTPTAAEPEQVRDEPAAEEDAAPPAPGPAPFEPDRPMPSTVGR